MLSGHWVTVEAIQACYYCLLIVVCDMCCKRLDTAGYLSFGPIEKTYYVCGDLSVREKDWRAAS